MSGIGEILLAWKFWGRKLTRLNVTWRTDERAGSRPEIIKKREVRSNLGRECQVTEQLLIVKQLGDSNVEDRALVFYGRTRISSKTDVGKRTRNVPEKRP